MKEPTALVLMKDGEPEAVFYRRSELEAYVKERGDGAWDKREYQFAPLIGSKP